LKIAPQTTKLIFIPGNHPMQFLRFIQNPTKNNLLLFSIFIQVVSVSVVLLLLVKDWTTQRNTNVILISEGSTSVQRPKHSGYLVLSGRTGSKPLCSLSCSDCRKYSEGTWKKTATSQMVDIINQDPIQYAYGIPGDQLYPLYDYYIKYQVFGKNNSGLRQLKNKYVNTLTYSWFPDKCDLIQWDTEDAAEVLRSAGILFVGDSLLRELAFSLGYLTGQQYDFFASYKLVDMRTLSPMPPDVYDFCYCLVS
jgi:hypothetical protein